jgi:hypothetical protein
VLIDDGVHVAAIAAAGTAGDMRLQRFHNRVRYPDYSLALFFHRGWLRAEIDQPLPHCRRFDPWIFPYQLCDLLSCIPYFQLCFPYESASEGSKNTIVT